MPTRLERVADVAFCAPCRVDESCGGIGVFATAAIPAGATLLIEKPFACTTSWAGRFQICATCMRQDDGRELPLRCEKCDCVAYCSASCAAVDKVHSGMECDALMAWAASEDEPEAVTADVADLVLQAIRILAHRHAARRIDPFPGSRGGEQLGYESYAQRVQGMERTRRTAEGIKLAVRAALRAVPPASRVPAPELYDVLSRQQCNAIGLFGARFSNVGLASFVGGMHLFNHSCYPNAAFDSLPLRSQHAGSPRDGGERSEDGQDSCDGVVFAMRAIRDIPVGGEIFHCYAGSADGPARRQQYLRDHHGFVCACERCACADDPMAEADLSERLDALRCRCDGCGSGLGYPVHAPGAGGERGDTVVECCVRRCVHCGGEWEADEEEW